MARTNAVRRARWKSPWRLRDLDRRRRHDGWEGQIKGRSLSIAVLEGGSAPATGPVALTQILGGESRAQDMDDSLEQPNIASARQEEDREQDSSGDEDGGLDWTRLP